MVKSQIMIALELEHSFAPEVHEILWKSKPNMQTAVTSACMRMRGTYLGTADVTLGPTSTCSHPTTPPQVTPINLHPRPLFTVQRSTLVTTMHMFGRRR